MKNKKQFCMCIRDINDGEDWPTKTWRWSLKVRERLEYVLYGFRKTLKITPEKILDQPHIVSLLNVDLHVKFTSFCRVRTQRPLKCPLTLRRSFGPAEAYVVTTCTPGERGSPNLDRSRPHRSEPLTMCQGHDSRRFQCLLAKESTYYFMEYIVHGSKNQIDRHCKLTLERVCRKESATFRSASRDGDL